MKLKQRRVAEGGKKEHSAKIKELNMQTGASVQLSVTRAPDMLGFSSILKPVLVSGHGAVS